jgi:glycosyltransferase involved in cell wall biosynthesis
MKPSSCRRLINYAVRSRSPVGSAQERISVALCTYNGERFLEEQLASIAQQTRLPDELVVCDDRSTDRTVAMVREFAASASWPVRIFENEHNLGSAANFERAIRLCSGDLIALSDQDDIWYPNRLERSEQELTAHAEAGLIFSDADVIDDQDRKQEKTLWQRLGFAGERKRELLDGRYIVLAKHRFVTGATVMFRAGLRDRVLPIGAGWIHDEWIALMVAAFSDLRPIDEPLIRYRIHGSQQVGLVNKLQQRARGNTRAQKHWGRLAESVKDLRQLCDVLSAIALDTKREVLPAYQQHLEFLTYRATLPGGRLARVGPVLRRYREYGVHASGLASVFKDLALKRQG